jgi:hypothetical protein
MIAPEQKNVTLEKAGAYRLARRLLRLEMIALKRFTVPVRRA